MKINNFGQGRFPVQIKMFTFTLNKLKTH